MKPRELWKQAFEEVYGRVGDRLQSRDHPIVD